MKQANTPSTAIDPAQFARLLAMAGPAIALELVAQLQIDLSVAKQALLAAGQSMDLPQIRAQSHVVIGLAGTIGATELLQNARILNDLAHNPAAGLAIEPALISETVQGIDLTLMFLSNHPLALATQE